MRRVAVVGLGNIATRHRRNLKMLFPEARLYAMSASGRIPTESVSDCDQIVAGIDELVRKQVELVIVASPAPFHAAHAIPLIEAGIPTLIEKPVTVSLNEAEAIQRAIAQYKTPVAVGYCLRYLSSAQKLKELLDQNKVGTLYNAFIQIGQYLPDWRPGKGYRDSVSANPKLGGGALLELSHELDYSRWLLGSLTLQHAILRSSQELELEVEDLADITVTTQQGALGHIHLDFLQRKAYRQCSFIGSAGRLDWDLIRNEIHWISAEGSDVLYSEPEWDKNQMYLNMLRDFIHMIQGKPHQCVELVEATETIQLIQQIKEQASGI
jgi:hypothetical protein